MHPLGPVYHLVGDIGEPSFGYALGPMLVDPGQVTVLALQVGQVEAVAAPKDVDPLPRLAPVHRGRQIHLAP